MEDKIIDEIIVKDSYIVRTVLVCGAQYGCDDYEVKKAYTLDQKYVGGPDEAEHLIIRRRISPTFKNNEINICTIGFCKSTNSWWGWSHRAIYEFKIGSTVKRGDCAYRASSVDELYINHCESYGNKIIKNKDNIEQLVNHVPAICDYKNNCLIIEHEMVKKVKIEGAPEYKSTPNILTNNKSSVPTIAYEDEGEEGIHYKWVKAPSNFQHVYTGKGEWEAKTIEDAKQMAIDFSDGVS